MAWAPPAPLLLAFLLFPALALATPRSEAKIDEYPDRYDEEFRKWSKRYFGPGFDWRWFKAQAVVESKLKPRAVGGGARGIMQILPSTYAKLRRENPGFGQIDDPRWNIAAGIYYNRQNYELWDDRVAEPETLNFALASYNAGPGRIEQAFNKTQKGGKDASRWTIVEHHAPRRTRRYVRQVHDLMGSELHSPSER